MLVLTSQINDKMLKVSLLIFTALTVFTSYSQNPVTNELKSPAQFLGYELGSYFSRHHQVIEYFEELEENSSGMMKLEKYGETNEHRNLVLAYVSTSENIQNLEKIKAAHASGENENVAIIWLSYNVHGNEASGTEASMQTAFELITIHKDWLNDAIVIIDPCLNPDGRDRYVNWYNQKKNVNYDTDVNSLEHDEPWPQGRSNHYLFDLNRDWAWLTQIETQQRIVTYNQWLPHVHVDFHEQYHNEPYYFAPAAEPMHDAITDWQKDYQMNLGRNHAKYFDENGWFYFTREIFDLLYPSYGDTYPTLNGAVGMTYEQGGHSTAGLGVITDEGNELSLKDRIAHHHTTGLSTVEFSAMKKDNLISEFNSFVSEDYKYKTYVVSGDMDKMRALVELLDAQDIEFTLGNGKKVKGFDYNTNESESIKTTENHILISSQQKRKGAMVKALFEPRTKLTDSLTYDITAWSLPYVYGLDCIASENEVTGDVKQLDFKASRVSGDVYAYLIPWNSFSDATALAELTTAGIKVRFAKEAFTFGDKEYGGGTLIVVKSENEGKDIDRVISETCLKHKINFETTITGMVDTGKDFGSSSVSLINTPKIGLLSGDGLSSLGVGEVWHFFEQDLHYPLTVFNLAGLSEESLSDIDVLVVPAGWGELPESVLANWISNGGKLIAIGGAVLKVSEAEGTALEAKEKPEATDEEKYENAHIIYSEKDRDGLTKEIKGAIYKCKVDNTHPLAFGYDSSYFSLKLDASAYNLLPEGDNVVYLEDNPEPISGFAGAKAKKLQANSLVFGVEYVGSGSIVYLVDNPLFRGFWENGKLFFVNSIFFVNN